MFSRFPIFLVTIRYDAFARSYALTMFRDIHPGSQLTGPAGPRLCFSWNRSGRCTNERCSFRHACSICGKNCHGKIACFPANKTSSEGPSSRPTNLSSCHVTYHPISAKFLAIFSLAWSSFHNKIRQSDSFHIGAATYAAAQGYADSQIRKLGRWKSYAFNNYIPITSFGTI